MRPTAAAAKPSFLLSGHQSFPTSPWAAGAADPCKPPKKSRRTGRSWRAASAGSDERGQSVSTVATTPSGRRARLSARRRESIRLLDVLPDRGGAAGGIGEFLRHPAGVESLLNTRALQSFLPVESDPAGAFRCTLHPMGFLGFRVAPVLDLRVTPTRDDCTVEMLSCRFEGSDSIEQQNELFSAVMTNRITWGDNCDQEPCLDIDVNLEVTLEVYTKPFSLLPLSAVEKPGNLASWDNSLLFNIQWESGGGVGVLNMGVHTLTMHRLVVAFPTAKACRRTTLHQHTRLGKQNHEEDLQAGHREVLKKY